MIYVFEIDEKIYVSDIDPDSTNDMHEIDCNSFVVDIPNSPKMPNSTKMGIIRNILANGEAKVLLK